MTEKVSDVVSQLEAVLGQIEARTPHGSECVRFPCNCGMLTRVRTEIARTVERMFGEVSKYWLTFGRAGNIVDSWAAAFRATQEHGEQK